MRILIFVLLVGNLSSLFSQDLSQEYLNKLEYEELLTLFNEVDHDSILAERVARTYLSKARMENDTIKMARGYDRLARIFHPRTNLKFADSIIDLTSNYSHITYPGLGYLIKAFEYDRLGNLYLSTQNHYNAYNLAIKNGNISHEIYSLEYLAYIKSYWGNKNEALNIQKEKMKIIKDSSFIEKMKMTSRNFDDKEILDLCNEVEINAHVGFAILYINLGKYDSAQMHFKRAELMLRDYKGLYKNSIRRNLQLCGLEIDFYKGSYQEIIKNSGLILNQINCEDNPSICFDVHMFKGIALIRQGNSDMGYQSLILSDSIYSRNYVRILPYRRMIFKTLADIYNRNGIVDKEIVYLKKLIVVDSIVKQNYKYFEPSFIEKVKTPRLIGQKEKLIEQLEKNNSKFRKANWLFISFLLFSIGLIIHYFRRQHIFKKRFDEIVKERAKNSETYVTKKKALNSISREVVEDLLEKLHNFEENNQFLQDDLNLHKLSLKFKTNDNYLSKVINLEMGKNFSQYLHDLRLDYAIKEVLSRKKFRKYTIKAIAFECGYSSAESFSRAFYKKNGIYPSYYIKKINQASK